MIGFFIQDNAPSHRRNLVQDFLMEKLRKRLVKHTEWFPAFLDCNPLDYHFWDKMKIKVYGNLIKETGKNSVLLKRDETIHPSFNGSPRER